MSGKIVVMEKMFGEDQKRKIRETAAECGYSASFYDSPAEACEAGALKDAEIMYGGKSAPFIAQAPNVKWVCAASAGVDAFCKEGVMGEDVLLSNASGAYGVTLTEYGIMAALMLMRGQVAFNRFMETREWMPPRLQSTLKDSRITCLGAGDIGQTFARRVKSFEPKSVTAVNRSGRTDADCFDAVYPQSELESVLANTDLLFMSLPGTPYTVDIINRETLACLPKTAYLVNVGRGTCIDEAALIEALNEDRLAGAALDVMRHEPLPKDDPLWSAKNLLLTPHVAGNLTAAPTRNKNVEMFCEDLVRYTKGLPLKHAVDRSKGY